MSIATATLPRAGGNGAALVVVVADMVIHSFTAFKENVAAFTDALAELTTVDAANESDLTKLFRLSARSDTVSHEVLEALRKAA